MGSLNISENLSSKVEIHGSLSPKFKGFQGPSYSSSSMSLAPIATRLPHGCINVNHAVPCDLQMVFIKDLKEHSSTWLSHKNKVPSTTYSPNIADLAYQSMVGFVLAKNSIPRIKERAIDPIPHMYVPTYLAQSLHLKPPYWSVPVHVCCSTTPIHLQVRLPACRPRSQDVYPVPVTHALTPRK